MNLLHGSRLLVVARTSSAGLLAGCREDLPVHAALYTNRKNSLTKNGYPIHIAGAPGPSPLGTGETTDPEARKRRLPHLRWLPLWVHRFNSAVRSPIPFAAPVITLVPAMCVHIAIPEPTGKDAEYNQRSLPAYLAALRSAGATPIIVPLHEHQDRVARLLSGVQGVFLPGSKFDVDPQRYGEAPLPECGEPDPARAAVDELLLQDAFSLHKPILAICGGMQSLNVWLNGSLIQDLKTAVNHSPGREVEEAHPVRITPGSRLASLIPRGSAA